MSRRAVEPPITASVLNHLLSTSTNCELETMEHSNQKAADLKAEGNALYTAAKFQEAYIKYTEAIQLDDRNAVLYANRAASSMATKELEGYLSAVFDLRVATQIDENYAKAWVRLASIFKEFHMYELSIDAANRALLCLETKELSPSEIKLKKQCEQALNGATEGMEKEQYDFRSLREKASSRVEAVPEDVSKSGRLPWDKARALREILAIGDLHNSSAWLILNAHEEFEDGLKFMHQLKFPEGDGIATGNPNALQYITNALLRDERAFYFSSPDFLKKLDSQITFEDQALRDALGNCPWTGSRGDVSTVQSQVTNLIKRKGWEVARRALSMTVRIWILNGLLSSNINDSPEESLRLYTNALSILEWGVSRWRNVSKEERGVIFERTFVRGVRCFCMNLYQINYNRGHIGDEQLKRLAQLAQDVLDEVDTHPAVSTPAEPLDIGFLIAFWYKPKAIAHASLGFVYWKGAGDKSMQKKARDEDLTQALSHYKSAIASIVVDDETRLYWETNVFEIMIEQAAKGEAAGYNHKRLKFMAQEILDHIISHPHNETINPPEVLHASTHSGLIQRRRRPQHWDSCI
ncbi:hypothetical protein CERSUDRAFT_90951 [Gelatoporia subvermispora B]|uniref:Uncharacterized protein n=1 Tax=Ceriporiopsis subvermispora (strain B) TaxID=914234 RepID=M2PZH1_CERS8|nr:hypothetical protein CERSUDRAFT_90951 [Gelatoporia subvermispora B]